MTLKLRVAGEADVLQKDKSKDCPMLEMGGGQNHPQIQDYVAPPTHSQQRPPMVD